jgi:hypothetical protein
VEPRIEGSIQIFLGAGCGGAHYNPSHSRGGEFEARQGKVSDSPPPPPGFGELAGLVEYLGEATNKTRICVCMYVRDWINTKGEDGGYLSGRAFA